MESAGGPRSAAADAVLARWGAVLADARRCPDAGAVLRRMHADLTAAFVASAVTGTGTEAQSPPKRRRRRAASALGSLPPDVARFCATWLSTVPLHAFTAACRRWRHLCTHDTALRNTLAGAFPLFFAFRADGAVGSAKLAFHPAGLFRRFAEARAAIEPLPHGSRWCDTSWTAWGETDTGEAGAERVRRTCGVVPVFLDRDSRAAQARARALVNANFDVPHCPYPSRAYLAYTLEKAQLPSLDTLAWRVQVMLDTKHLASSHAAALKLLPPVDVWAEPGWRSELRACATDDGCDIDYECGVVPLIPGRPYCGRTVDEFLVDWGGNDLPKGDWFHGAFDSGVDGTTEG